MRDGESGGGCGCVGWSFRSERVKFGEGARAAVGVDVDVGCGVGIAILIPGLSLSLTCFSSGSPRFPSSVLIAAASPSDVPASLTSCETSSSVPKGSNAVTGPRSDIGSSRYPKTDSRMTKSAWLRGMTISAAQPDFVRQSKCDPCKTWYEIYARPLRSLQTTWKLSTQCSPKALWEVALGQRASDFKLSQVIQLPFHPTSFLPRWTLKNLTVKLWSIGF